MYKTIASLFLVVLSACAAGNKAVKPPQTPTAPAVPPVERSLQYRVFIPGDDWQVLQNVKLQEGLAPAKMLIRHKAGETFDAVVIVMTSPAEFGGPQQLSEMSRGEDEKRGAIVTAVTCNEQAPPTRCEYRGVVQGKDGAVQAIIVFKSLPETRETAALSGFWKQGLDGTMSEAFDKIADSFSVSAK